MMALGYGRFVDRIALYFLHIFTLATIIDGILNYSSILVVASYRSWCPRYISSAFDIIHDCAATKLPLARPSVLW